MMTSTDDFKIKTLARDKDALVLIGITIIMLVTLILGLSLLTDAQWDRLVDRSKVLWAAGLSIVPAMLALYARFKLREASVTALAVATQPPAVPAGNPPAGVTHIQPGTKR